MTRRVLAAIPRKRLVGAREGLEHGSLGRWALLKVRIAWRIGAWSIVSVRRKNMRRKNMSSSSRRSTVGVICFDTIPKSCLKRVIHMRDDQAEKYTNTTVVAHSPQS